MSKMFAAIGMGAGVVDLYNDFNMNWGWSYAAPGGSGDSAFNYYLYDQGRWGFSPWDQPDRYRNESALTWASSTASRSTTRSATTARRPCCSQIRTRGTTWRSSRTSGI
jgi:hypothetical protein